MWKKEEKSYLKVFFCHWISVDVEEWLNSAYEAIAKEAEIEAQTMLQQQHSQQEQQHSLVEQQHYETSHEEFIDDGGDDHPQHAPHVVSHA